MPSTYAFRTTCSSVRSMFLACTTRRTRATSWLYSIMFPFLYGSKMIGIDTKSIGTSVMNMHIVGYRTKVIHIHESVCSLYFAPYFDHPISVRGLGS